MFKTITHCKECFYTRNSYPNRVRVSWGSQHHCISGDHIYYYLICNCVVFWFIYRCWLLLWSCGTISRIHVICLSSTRQDIAQHTSTHNPNLYHRHSNTRHYSWVHLQTQIHLVYTQVATFTHSNTPSNSLRPPNNQVSLIFRNL